MVKFTIMYRNGKEKVYEVEFTPRPTINMCVALARAMLIEKGGQACAFVGPNGLFGMIQG